MSMLLRAHVGRPFQVSRCPPASRRSCVFRSRPGVCRAQGGDRDELGDLDQRLLEDLQRLQQKSAGAAAPAAQQQQQQQRAAPAGYSGAAPEAQGGVGSGIKDAIDKLLIADFFFILFALAWFAVGLAQQSATQSTALLDSWYSLWQWVFQPAIGVLMLGAIVSGLVDWIRDSTGKK